MSSGDPKYRIGASLSSTDLHLDEAKNGVIAKGPGHLEHTDTGVAKKLKPGEEAALSAREIGHTLMTWTRGMRYDGAAGEGEGCDGSTGICPCGPICAYRRNSCPQPVSSHQRSNTRRSISGQR